MPILPMDNPRPPMTGKQKVAAGGGIAAAVALAVSIIAPWEGKKNDPYLDIVKVQTVCYGQTRVEMRHYTDAECKDMLAKAVGNDFAPKVIACVPGLADRPNQAAAAISLSYNIGTGAFCKSSAARLMNAGDWKRGCQAMGRFIFAGGKPVKGLVNRRNSEIALCMKGL